MSDVYDCIIIGGGPAGLTAAIYLARFRRNFLVFDAGESRAEWIPVTHNLAGFPEGISGVAFLARIRTQAERYGASIIQEHVEKAEAVASGFRVASHTSVNSCKTIFLATGIKDIEPALPHTFGAVQKGLIRFCPVCDAFEVIDKKIAVLGHGTSGLGEAAFLTDYSRDVTLLTLGEKMDPTTSEYKKMIEKGLKVMEDPVSEVIVENDRITCLKLASGMALSFDTIYSALGCKPRNRLAMSLGIRIGDDDGRIYVDRHQETSVKGCFAAGDIVRGLNQISVAVGQAAIAATTIHNRLRD